MEPIFERRLLMERLGKCGVKILSQTSVTQVNREGVQIEGEIVGLIPCDHLVLDEVSVPNHSLLKELRGKVKVIGIGDCTGPGDLYKAFHAGFQAGYSIG